MRLRLDLFDRALRQSSHSARGIFEYEGIAGFVQFRLGRGRDHVIIRERDPVMSRAACQRDESDNEIQKYLGAYKVTAAISR